MPKTVKDARLEVLGIGGAIVRYNGGPSAKTFAMTAERLGRQIAKDNGVVFETGEVPDETPLSELALHQFWHLQEIKRGALILRGA